MRIINALLTREPVKTILIRGLHNIKSKNQGCVLTIGNFDGVHRGHQALLDRVKQRSQALGIPALVMTFEPQPFEFFAREKSAPRLTRWREKFSLLSEYGIDQVLVVRFDQSFAALTPQQFAEEILCQQLKIKELIVGDDFHFGSGREGNLDFLESVAYRYGFTIEAMPTKQLLGERISSSRVRAALALGNHELANELLGRPYTMVGRIVPGDQRGRILGFPTANIFLHRRATPVHGVYVVKMHGIAEHPLPGVANVGTRPTFDGVRILLEVHLFNFNEDIYGRHVSVEFCKKLRDEVRYPNAELLTQQILLDARDAREYFKERGEM